MSKRTPVTKSEETILYTLHGALTMACGHTEASTGSVLKMLSQVMLLLADGEGEEALERLRKYVELRKSETKTEVL
jgi:Flp pilus assembly protein TadD